MLKKEYPYYLANEAVQANNDLKIYDKYSGELATTAPLATPDVLDQAIEAARKSVKRINTNSTAGVGDVTERCARCIRRLEAAEAPAELIEKVESFCERKVGQIGKSQENAKQKIRDAFGDTDPGELE